MQDSKSLTSQVIVEIDAYTILGVSPSCERPELDQAYAKLNDKYERLVGVDPWARQAIREAYRKLSTDESSIVPTGTNQLLLQNETTYFILVNVLDIFLTYMLLALGAIEANPMAAYFYDNWGFNGMIAFKLFLVAVVCVVTQVIARRKLNYARGVLLSGIFIVGIVVVYSLKLLVGQL